jgi:hypothetical protein
VRILDDNRTKPKEKRQVNPNSLANLKKGGSPGRKPIPQEFKELAEKYSITALEKAIQIMQNVNEKTADRIKAIEIVLDRGIGKPLQQLDMTSGDEPLQVIFNIPRPPKDE